jgi:F-box protein 11
MICRNDITGNNDGIVVITSVPIVKRNYIAKNRSNGIIMMKNAQAEIKENLISENEAVGIYLRDRSYGEIDSNVVNGNEIDVALERLDHRSKELAAANSVSGEIRTPKKVSCAIF